MTVILQYNCRAVLKLIKYGSSVRELSIVITPFIITIRWKESVNLDSFIFPFQNVSSNGGPLLFSFIIFYYTL